MISCGLRGLHIILPAIRRGDSLLPVVASNCSPAGRHEGGGFRKVRQTLSRARKQAVSARRDHPPSPTTPSFGGGWSARGRKAATESISKGKLSACQAGASPSPAESRGRAEKTKIKKNSPTTGGEKQRQSMKPTKPVIPKELHGNPGNDQAETKDAKKPTLMRLYKVPKSS